MTIIMLFIVNVYNIISEFYISNVGIQPIYFEKIRS